MGSVWLITWLVTALVALAMALLSSMQVWEHRRFVRNRLYKPKPGNRPGRVALFAPCKGIDLDLERNLAPLLDQDYGDYEVTFIVESEADPACATIRKLLSQSAAQARLLVAGKATDSGQKVHNLLQATASLGPDVKVLAFVDSDARPRRDWLRQLVQRLDRPVTDASTGYRWFVPERPTLANHLLASVNAAIATLFGAGSHNLVWGGSWAIRREVFETIGLRKAWVGTLSDDLVAARLLQDAGMRIEFEPSCMVASPVDHDWRQVWGFLRRQYVVGRFYASFGWFMGLMAAAVTNVAVWGGAVLFGVGLATGHPWSWVPGIIFAAWYGMGIYRGFLRRQLALMYLPEMSDRLQASGRFELWTSPLVALANFIGMLSALVGRCITWRGITYELSAGGQVRILSDANVPARSESASGKTAAGPSREPLSGPHCQPSARVLPPDK